MLACYASDNGLKSCDWERQDDRMQMRNRCRNGCKIAMMSANHIAVRFFCSVLLRAGIALMFVGQGVHLLSLVTSRTTLTMVDTSASIPSLCVSGIYRFVLFVFGWLFSFFLYLCLLQMHTGQTRCPVCIFIINNASASILMTDGHHGFFPQKKWWN